MALKGNGEWLPGSGTLTGSIRQHKFTQWQKRNPGASPAKAAKARERIYAAVKDSSRAR